jgi:hypothetical protein
MIGEREDIGQQRLQSTPCSLIIVLRLDAEEPLTASNPERQQRHGSGDVLLVDAAVVDPVVKFGLKPVPTQNPLPPPLGKLVDRADLLSSGAVRVR